MAVKFVFVFMLAALAIASAVPESLATPSASMAQRDAPGAYYASQYLIPTIKDSDSIQKQFQAAWNKIKSAFGDEGVTTATEFQEVRNDLPIEIFEMGDEGVTLSDPAMAQTSETKKLLDKIMKKLRSLRKKSSGDEGVTTATQV